MYSIPRIFFYLPQPKKSTNFSNKDKSLECWVIENSMSVRGISFKLFVRRVKEKLPSPVVKPATQAGEGIISIWYYGSFCCFDTCKLSFNSSDKPKFKEDLKDNIVFRPSNVKCSLFTIKLTIFLNKI